MQLQLLEVQEPKGLENAFRIARQGRAEVLTVVATGLSNSHRPRIINLAANSRLPTMYSNPDFVLEGGLMSYAADPVAQSQRAATYVDKILKGAKPSRSPSGAAEEIRVDHQSESRQADRPDDSAECAGESG
jgi:putative tryptophan/tyrosine transport system substrate-binding protein